MKGQEKFTYPLFDFGQFKLLNLNKEKTIEVLDSLLAERSIESLRKRLVEIRKIILNPKFDNIGLLNISSDGDVVNFRRDILISEIDFTGGAHKVL